MRTSARLMLAACFALLAPIQAPAVTAKATRKPIAAVDTWDAYKPVTDRINQLNNFSRFDDMRLVLDSLDAVMRGRPDASLALLVRFQRARLEFIAGRVDRADTLLQAIARDATRQREYHTEVAAVSFRAFLDYTRNQPKRQELRMRQAIALARLRGYPKIETTNLDALGDALEMQGRLRETVDVYRLMVAQAKSRGYDHLMTRALGGLARALHASDRRPEARVAYLEAITVATRRGERNLLPNIYVNLGNLESDEGNTERSEAYFREGMATGADHVDVSDWSACAGELARRALRRGDLASADSLLQSALPEVAGATDRYFFANLVMMMGRVRLGQGRLVEGRSWLRRALAVADSSDELHRRALPAEIAGQLADWGWCEEALGVLDTMLARPGTRIDGQLERNVRLGRAYALVGLHRWREAIREMSPFAGSNRLGPGAAGTDRAYIQTLLARSYRGLGRVDSALFWCRAAVRTLEQGRRATREAPVLLMADRYGSMAAFEYASTLLDPARGGTRERRVREAFAALQVAGPRAVFDRPTPPGTAGSEAVFDVAGFQRTTLRPGDVYVQLAAGADTTLVFCATRDSLRFWYAPRLTDLRDRLDRFASLLADRERADAATWLPAARALGREIFGPGTAVVAHAQTLLLASDELGSQPLGELVLDGSDVPLSVTHALATVPSAWLLQSGRRATPQVAPAHALAALGRSHDPLGRPLTGAGKEVGALADGYQHVVAVMDSRRSATQLLRDPILGGAVIHFATHAQVDPEKPWRAGLLLGDPAGRDPWLRAGTIAGLHASARLCVLAACRTLGNVQVGESYGGLASAWLMAGVPTVVASRWNVDDAATLELMRRFYAGLARGLDVSRALRDAQAGLRAMPQYAAPYWWAGFVVVGDPSTRVSLKVRS